MKSQNIRNLTIAEAEALCRWAIDHYNTNWGTWSKYPVSGCSYLQFDDNPLVVKFDEMVQFSDEKFKRIGWGRKIPGKENAVTFSWLISEVKKITGNNFGTYPEKRFTKEIDGKQISYFIRQSPYADYPSPDVCLLDDNGNILRSGITPASKYYPWGEI